MPAPLGDQDQTSSNGRTRTVNDDDRDQELKAALGKFLKGKIAEGMTREEAVALAHEHVAAARRAFVLERRSSLKVVD